MKKLFLLTMFVVCVLSVSAQNTKVITGVVIDKNGNPLPNALVEATGGAENVTTDADGSFRIEVPIWLKSLTAKYAGLRDKKIKIKDKSRLVFEMSEPGCWFLDAVYSANFASDYFTRVGLMGGYLGEWGGYAKVLMPLGVDDSIPSVTAGVIKQVAQPVYVYLGVGYSRVFEYHKYYGKYWDGYDGGMLDIGAVIRVKKFNVGIGYSCCIGYNDTFNNSVQISAGYCF